MATRGMQFFVMERKTFEIDRVKDQIFRISEKGKGFAVAVSLDDKLRQWIIMVVADAERRKQKAGLWERQKMVR